MLYIYFRLLSGIHIELRTHEIDKVRCNVSFPHENPGLGRCLDGEGVPLLTNSGGMGGNNSTLFRAGAVMTGCFFNFFLCCSHGGW